MGDTNTKQHQEELLLSSFLDMVNAPDGDFTVLGQLAKVSSDQAKPLFGVNWNNLWETPIEQVRSALNILDVSVKG
jgi:ubiquinone biosynthesis protein Coq4